MGALIFVIVVAAIVITLVVGVQKNKKKKASQEPEIHKAADPIELLPKVSVDPVASDVRFATDEEHQALAEAKKEVKSKKMAAKPKKSAEPVKRTRAKK